jgi:hypothetical protein
MFDINLHNHSEISLSCTFAGVRFYISHWAATTCGTDIQAWVKLCPHPLSYLDCISGWYEGLTMIFDFRLYCKLYQGSRKFSEQKFRFPWHKMKFTINWLFCPYRSNQHRSWTVLHSHLSYWLPKGLV